MFCDILFWQLVCEHIILFIIISLVETTYYPLSNSGVKVLSFELFFATDYYMNYIWLFLVAKDYYAKSFNR